MRIDEKIEKYLVSETKLPKKVKSFLDNYDFEKDSLLVVDIVREFELFMENGKKKEAIDYLQNILHDTSRKRDEKNMAKKLLSL